MKHVQQVCWLCDTSWGRVHSNSKGIMNNRVARNVMLKKGWYFAVEKKLCHGKFRSFLWKKAICECDRDSR